MSEQPEYGLVAHRERLSRRPGGEAEAQFGSFDLHCEVEGIGRRGELDVGRITVLRSERECLRR